MLTALGGGYFSIKSITQKPYFVNRPSGVFENTRVKKFIFFKKAQEKYKNPLIFVVLPIDKGQKMCYNITYFEESPQKHQFNIDNW